MEIYPSKNIAIDWVEKGSIARNLFLSLGFAIITALSAQIRIVIPISPRFAMRILCCDIVTLIYMQELLLGMI